MPQDSRSRSVVYRSFVTCDDPKGVVESKTIRKSKWDYSRRQQDNSSKSTDEEAKDKVPGGSSVEDLQNLSTIQIMEVSRGAQKLNHVIDSWSNGRRSFDKQSEYIAKDLLKGALDLQESLVMLGKLQEASKYIAKSKKRHEDKPAQEFMDSYPFGDYCHTLDFEKPRKSRDCYDELREAITESFARQNLLSAKEKEFLGRKSVDSYMDVPSSSSSSHSYCSPLKVQLEKSKGPNLIAKLMGLNEVPSRPNVSLLRHKQMEKEKLSMNQARHLLDIDLPRPRKPPHFVVQKVARERRTLEEMIETMQFKGLLERKYIDGEDHNDVTFLRKRLAVEDPPIVIMRPLRVRNLRTKELANCHMDKGKPANALEVPRGHLKATEMHEKFPRTSRKKLNKDKEGKHCAEPPPRPVNNIQPSPSSTKLNRSKPLVPKVQKKEADAKKIDKVSKEAVDKRKRAEIKATKSQESTKTQDIGKSTCLKKTVRRSNAPKGQIAREKTEAPDERVKSTSLTSSTRKKILKKDKLDCAPSAASVEDIAGGENLSINIPSDIQGSLTDSTAFEQITAEITDASCNPVPENSENSTSSPIEMAIKEGIKYVDDGSYIPCDLDEMTDRKSITGTRYTLLTDASFLSRVEELFDMGTCDSDTTVSRTAQLHGFEMPDNYLLLECAKEILQRKSLRCKMTIFPSPRKLFQKPKCHLYLEQLVDEISDGIEDLRSYSKSYAGDIVLVDSIYSMLERDLWLKGEVTGAWDFGWSYGFTLNDFSEVVNNVENLVLSEVVDDVITEFML